jgi:S-adenosylmethionine:tRNA ribosyltransferase-isomerase
VLAIGADFKQIAPDPDAPMKTDLFDFELPRERIAQAPAEPRDSARMLVVGETMADKGVRDLPGLLRPGDALVVNDTRVIPARLTGRRGEAKMEITLHRRRGPDDWLAFARPARKLSEGDVIAFDAGLIATVTEKREAGEVALRLAAASGDTNAALEQAGAMPLPPYIERKQGPVETDRQDYQTIYATHPGAVAAPTAGLHFTDALMAAIADAGVAIHRVTLHVGAGTFLPVKADDTTDHKMHSEWGKVTAETAEALNAARSAGGRILAAGTTSLRLLESAATEDRVIAPFEGDTDIFITPGYRFRAVDLLLTNFHLPRSTLFMLVSAFAGLERMKAAYAHAIADNYRFYSYGDACLLYPGEDAA